MKTVEILRLPSNVAIAAVTFWLIANPIAQADELLGWNNFRFGSTRQEVLRAGNGTAHNTSDSSIYILDVDFADIKVRVDFFFDQLPAGETAGQHYRDTTTGGSLTKVFIMCINETQTCADYEPKIKSGLKAHYGDFFEKIVQQRIGDSYRGPIISDPHLRMTYGLYKPFANNTFIFARLQSLNVGSSHGTVSQCVLNLTYGVKPPLPPALPKLPAQGF